MDLGIRKRTALVLGGGGGLGSAVALALAREGVNVAVADMNEAAAGKVRDAVQATGAKACSLLWNLADLKVIEPNIATIEKALGPVEILINNTGGPPPTPAAGQQAALWSQHFQAMVLSVIAITDRVLPPMRASHWGRIITSTSSGVLAPIANLGISNALRLSLVGWSKTLAREVAQEGITCNVVAPGRIATARVRSLDEAKALRESRTADEIAADSAAIIPMGRYGEPAEYANVVAFLASECASYVTGSIVRVDGGLIPSV